MMLIDINESNILKKNLLSKSDRKQTREKMKSHGQKLWIEVTHIYVETRSPSPRQCLPPHYIHTSTRSPRVVHFVPCRPEVPTPLGVSSTQQKQKREPARGTAAHVPKTEIYDTSGALSIFLTYRIKVT